MARIPGIRSVFRLPVSEGRVSNEVADEIAFHLEERARELVARGLDPAAARAEALREFGDVGEARVELEAIDRRRVRQAHRSSWWSDLRQDVRHAVRSLRKAPGFTLVAAFTLALGIGATTAIYTVVDAVLLRGLGVADPERLVVLWEMDRDPEPNRVAPANFFDWEAQARSFSSMAYFVQWPMNLTGSGEPQEVQAQLVSADFFRTLGARPLLGRDFRPEDGGTGDVARYTQGDVVVLSHALWRSRFGGDPSILGETIRVDDQPRTVVGVMGPDFRVLDKKPDLWIPLSLPRRDRESLGRFLTGVARLKPGVPLERAADEMSAIARRLEEAYPAYDTGWGIKVVPWRDQVVGPVRPALLVLLGAVGMLLLIACTNVANLLLGRASARRTEIVVRLSLGATRGRLVRQLLTESVALSLVGGGIGVAAAALGTRALVRSLPASVQLPRLDAVAVDGRVLAFALGVTLLTGVLFGLAPALAASRTDLQGTLRDAARGTTGGRGALRLRGGLVVAEVALALMLLVGAGLLLRSFQKLQQVDTGMRAEGVLTLRMGLGSDAYDSDDAMRGFLARLLPGLRALPGVRAAGTIWFLPLSGDRSNTAAYRPDRPKPAAGQEPSADIRVVGGDYFRAQGIRILRGRGFDARDHARSATTFVINEALAREHFPGEDPIGKRMAYEWDDLIVGEIVGVVEDTRDAGVAEPPAPAIYRAFAQAPSRLLNVVIRTAGDPMTLAGPAREVVRRLDPNLPVASVRSMESVVSEATARPRLSGYLLGAFAAIALLLAAIGLYGVISYGVAQRRGEIGVRVALGAARGDIVGLIVRQGMTVTAAGLALGLAGALALTRLLRSLLFGVTTTDALTFAAVPLLLVTVALVASYLPASRAARQDPATALRAQ
ncbi:MAG TPA: ABC transporter permease [Longimicrobiales bacterium]|nr:ABC transporter permease [Longimicrobiales bacterium]